jgi:hypothetical protein
MCFQLRSPLRQRALNQLFKQMMRKSAPHSNKRRSPFSVRASKKITWDVSQNDLRETVIVSYIQLNSAYESVLGIL